MKKMKKGLKTICAAVLLMSMVLQGAGIIENVQAAPAAGENEGNLLSYSHFSIGSSWNIATNGATGTYVSDKVPNVGTTSVRKISWEANSEAASKIAYAIQNVSGIDISKSYKFTMWVKIEADAELTSPFLTRFIAKWTDNDTNYSRTFNCRNSLTTTQGDWVKYETILNFEDNASDATTVKSFIESGGEVTYDFRIVMPCQSEQAVAYYFTDACLVEQENLTPPVSTVRTTTANLDCSAWKYTMNGNTREVLNASGLKITTTSSATGMVNADCYVNELVKDETYRLSFDLDISQDGVNEISYDSTNYSSNGSSLVRILHQYTNASNVVVAKILSTNKTTKHFEFPFTCSGGGSGALLKFTFVRPATDTSDIVYTLSNLKLVKETDADNLCAGGNFTYHNGTTDFDMAKATTGFVWGNSTTAKSNLDYEVVTTEEHGNALKITSAEYEAGVFLQQQSMSLVANTEYLVSYWIKAEQGSVTDSWGSVYTRMIQKDGNNESVNVVYSSSAYKVSGDTNGWIQISYRHTTPTTLTSAIFDFALAHQTGAIVYIADVQIVKAPTVIDSIDLDGINFDTYKWSAASFSFAESLDATGYTVVERWEQSDYGRFYTSDETINSGLLEKETFTANTFEAAKMHRYSIVFKPADGYCIDTTTKLVCGENTVNAKIYYLDETGAIIDYNTEATLQYTVGGILIYPEGNELFTTVAGDCTKDGKATIQDLVRMKRYGANQIDGLETFIDACDFVENGAIDDDDFKGMRTLLVSK